MEKEITEMERDIIIAQLETVSPGLHLSIGGKSEVYSRNELLERLKKGDSVGDDYIRMQLEFLRAFKDRTLMKNLNDAS